MIGTIVPGSTLIIGICALASSAHLNPWPLLGATIVGAIFGDGLSFWLGRRYHREILLRWPLNRYPQFIDRIYQDIRRCERLPRSFHSGSARICAVGCRHLRNVIAPVLCRQYSVGFRLGTGPHRYRMVAAETDGPANSGLSRS